ncbi:hypothetical protein Pcinc_020293 [Petrolisthes cinctipes]|uniref:Uncharacterized protein n=1 Tax=Petrolisthes cinctipes TaxID=88211 RepID=A0AAE1FIJ8_PETCI|nr:hypothetical protein Pcinc_020293 [Petrolisthes cinctipes]
MVGWLVYGERENRWTQGTTVVVVSRRGESGGSRVEVHGAPGILPTLLPPHTHHHHQHHTHHHHTLARTTISTTTTTTTTTTATTTPSRGQGIDASATCARVSLPPHDLLNILADKGYIPTVRSWWVCQETGGLITQWLVYKRGRRRIKSGGKTQHASSSSSSSTLSSSTLRRATSASHLLSAVSPHLSTSSTNLTTINTNNTTNTIKDVITLKGKGGEKGKGGKEKLGDGKDKREWGREKGEKKERKEEDDGAKGGVGGGGGGINSDDEKDETKKENGGGGGGVRGGAGGTLRNRLKTRSKSIISLATDHSTRPALTLKRLLNALL